MARVAVVDHPRLQDGPSSEWPHGVVAELVNTHIRTNRIPAVNIITFDVHGVTSHTNHVAVHHGVRKAVEAQGLHGPIHLYELRTVGFLRRYLGVLDMLLVLCATVTQRFYMTLLSRLSPTTTDLSSDDVVVCMNWSPWSCHEAMCKHQSQYNWYRKLYVLVSRYVFVNTLHRHRDRPRTLSNDVSCT